MAESEKVFFTVKRTLCGPKPKNVSIRINLRFEFQVEHSNLMMYIQHWCVQRTIGVSWCKLFFWFDIYRKKFTSFMIWNIVKVNIWTNNLSRSQWNIWHFWFFLNDSDFDQDLCWVLRLEISVVEQITPFCYDYWANNVDLFWKLSILLESAERSNLIFSEFFDPNNVVELLVLWKTEKEAESNQSTMDRWRGLT